MFGKNKAPQMVPPMHYEHCENDLKKAIDDHRDIHVERNPTYWVHYHGGQAQKLIESARNDAVSIWRALINADLSYSDKQELAAVWKDRGPVADREEFLA